MKISPRLAILALLFSSLYLCGQDSTGASATRASALPAVSFIFDFPASQPDHYSIQVASDGSASYESTAKLSPDSDDKDEFKLDFAVSAPMRAKIFDLAARSKYFEGKIDSGKRNIAFTGRKTLAYRDGQRSNQATYNYSPNPAVQELTTLFQNVSTTLEFGRRLQYDHRYQKLALDEELKRMEEMMKSNSLGELQAVQPILSEIAADQSVINVVRARAQRLLAMAGAPSVH